MSLFSIVLILSAVLIFAGVLFAVMTFCSIRVLQKKIEFAVRARPGLLASQLAVELGYEELALRIVLRAMEDQGTIVTLPESGDRRIWLSSS